MCFDISECALVAALAAISDFAGENVYLEKNYRVRLGVFLVLKQATIR